MKIKPQELENAGYKLRETLAHDAIIPFIQESMRLKNPFSIGFSVINLLLLGFTAGFFVLHILRGDLSIGLGLGHLFMGVGLAFLLVPIHELIHGMAYKFVGAEHTSYDANWRKFYFLAVADQFVINKRELEIVALAPFLLITCLGLLSMMWLGLPWQVTMTGMVLTHTTFCGGDFGLLSYMTHHKALQLVTYDDKKLKVSYIYEKVVPSNSLPTA
ncbi:MAG: DUF3267 domain-containing protein [Bacteroidota bacterium]